MPAWSAGVALPKSRGWQTSSDVVSPAPEKVNNPSDYQRAPMDIYAAPGLFFLLPMPSV